MRQQMMGCVGESAAGFEQADFTYTGNYTWVQEDPVNWRLKFLSSGVFTPKKNVQIEVFLLGGGGGGRSSSSSTGYSGGGGAGGKTAILPEIALFAGKDYTISIGSGGVTGAGGGATSFETNSVSGGSNNSDYRYGGNGGSGGGGGNSGYGAQGHGGSNGSGGTKSDYIGGSGQEHTTYEFEDSSLTLYAGGGGGGAGQYGGSIYGGGNGGAGGGAAGGVRQGGAGGKAPANFGGGGGGGGGKSGATGTGGAGGSGIVVIRNKRS